MIGFKPLLLFNYGHGLNVVMAEDLKVAEASKNVHPENDEDDGKEEL